MKKLLACFIFLSFISLLPADSVSKFLQFNLSSSTTRGIEKSNTLFAGEAGFAARWFDGLVGIQGYEDAFDFTVAGEGYFPFANWDFDEARLALGIGSLYHFQRYKDISTEHDWIFDSVFRYHTYTGFTLTFRGGYSFKMSRIDALADYISPIWDKYPSAGIRIEKLFSNGLELYYEHSTHDLYRYPVFCTPDYILGAALNMDSGLRFGGEIELRFSDQYTTAPYCNGLILRMTARYAF